MHTTLSLAGGIRKQDRPYSKRGSCWKELDYSACSKQRRLSSQLCSSFFQQVKLHRLGGNEHCTLRGASFFLPNCLPGVKNNHGQCSTLLSKTCATNGPKHVHHKKQKCRNGRLPKTLLGWPRCWRMNSTSSSSLTNLHRSTWSMIWHLSKDLLWFACLPIIASLILSS